MVSPVANISGSVSSMGTRADTSLSITSEAYNLWVATRQSAMTAGYEALQEGADRQRQRKPSRHRFESLPEEQDTDNVERLSGESTRIGTRNFRDGTPFGQRVLIV